MNTTTSPSRSKISPVNLKNPLNRLHGLSFSRLQLAQTRLEKLVRHSPIILNSFLTYHANLSPELLCETRLALPLRWRLFTSHHGVKKTRCLSYVPPSSSPSLHFSTRSYEYQLICWQPRTRQRVVTNENDENSVAQSTRLTRAKAAGLSVADDNTSLAKKPLQTKKSTTGTMNGTTRRRALGDVTNAAKGVEVVPGGKESNGYEVWTAVKSCSSQLQEVSRSFQEPTRQELP